MKIHKVKIENFRGISKVELNNLGDLVVIAGPNGCGKSSIFDAIRLLKSAYGGYQDNEMDQWINEFQLDFSHERRNVEGIFRDKSKPILISAEFSLTDQEKEFLKENGERLLRTRVLSSISPSQYLFSYKSLASEIRMTRAEMQELLNKESNSLKDELKQDIFIGQINIDPEPEVRIEINPNPALELVFSSYVPKEIGIIDYHGPHRNYNRERIGGVNLTIESEEQRMSQHALYNYVGKYSNVKSEMAGAYIRELIAKESGATLEKNTLSDTLTELFRTFFSGKEFLGPQPAKDGNLNFPVKLSTGETHDIDELSSGEKEIIYGYLRLRNNTPHNSVLLLDEPELHLNPRLIHGLPQFYNRHLGKVFNNQIWLVTHSDAFLREAVGDKDFSVFHMQLPIKGSTSNQAHMVNVSEDLERAVFDLIGDYSTYQPEKKIVIFEGGGDSEFDITMTTSLFPNFLNEVNPISGGNKKRVSELHSILEEVSRKGKIGAKFFSIVDKDSDEAPLSTTALAWDVYHIENYLLREEFILQSYKELKLKEGKSWTLKDVERELLSCAKETLGELTTHILVKEVYEAITGSINVGSDPKSSSISKALLLSLSASKERFLKQLQEFSEEELDKREKKIKKKFSADLKGQKWKKTFKGRSILKLFVGKHVSGINYENFRDLVISKMVISGYEPEGMKKIIEKILTPSP